MNFSLKPIGSCLLPLLIQHEAVSQESSVSYMEHWSLQILYGAQPLPLWDPDGMSNCRLQYVCSPVLWGGACRGLLLSGQAVLCFKSSAFVGF